MFRSGINHVLHKVNWQTVYPDHSMVSKVQQTISDFTNNEFLELLESWANKISPDQLHISIPRIELDLGILYDNNLNNLLIESTRDALSRLRIESGDYDIGSPVFKDFDSRLENFQFTLDTGIHISRLSSIVKPVLLVELCELLRINRRQTIIMLSLEKSERFRAASILNDSNKKSVDSAILLLSPLYGSKILFLINRMSQFLSSQGLSYRKIEELNDKIYRISFSYLIQSAFVGFSEQGWLALMIDLIDECGDVEITSDGLAVYLGIHVDLQIKNKKKKLLQRIVNKIEEKEIEYSFSQMRISQLCVTIDHCLSLSGVIFHSNQTYETLIDTLNILYTLDYRIYCDKLNLLFDYLSKLFKAETVFEVEPIDKTLKLFYDIEYYILDHDLSILDAVLVAKFGKSYSFILKKQVLKVIVSKRGNDCAVGNVIKKMIHFVSKRFTIKHLALYEYLQELTNRLEVRCNYLLENRMWMSILKTSAIKRNTSDLTIQPIQYHLYRKQDLSLTNKHLLKTNFTIDDSKINLIWNVRNLLQKRFFNSMDEFRLYQYFELAPDLVCKEVYQCTKDSSFYDFCQFDSAGLWLVIQEHLFKRSGHQLSSYLQELHNLAISDLHLEFMFPFISRKAFILIYENPELSPTEVLVKLIQFIQENEVISFERKFAVVANYLASPVIISEEDRIIRAKTYLAEQSGSVDKIDLENVLSKIGTEKTNNGYVVNLIRNIRRFNPEELFRLSLDLQKEISLTVLGEPFSVNDVGPIIESKIIEYGSFFDGKRELFSQELFWEAIVYSADTESVTSFQSRISRLLDEFLYGSVKIFYIKTTRNNEAAAYDNDTSILAPQTACVLKEGNSVFNTEMIHEMYNYQSTGIHQLNDGIYSCEGIDYADLLNLIKQKNTTQLMSFCNAVSLEDIAILIGSSNSNFQYDFCHDSRKLKAILRKLSSQFSVRESSLSYLILKELDGDAIIFSWTQGIMKAEERLLSEIRNIADNNSITEGENSNNLNISSSGIELNFELVPEISINQNLQSVPTNSNFKELVQSIGVSGIIKLIQHVLDVGRLPLWIGKDFQTSPSSFINYIFKTHPEWIRHIFRNTHLERTGWRKLLSFLKTEELIHFFTISDFMSKEEGEEYYTVYKQLLCDKVAKPYSLGILLADYWVQSECEIIEKAKFYQRLILGCYRDSFCGVDIFKTNLSKCIKGYPSDFQASFISLFPPGQKIILPERITKPTIKKKRFEEVLTNGISINNGGIVLISNYMKELFNRLGLLNDGQFVSNLHKQKGVLALHYFVSGTDIINMQNDILVNKILCGFPVDEYLDFECNLDDNDKSIVDGLISAMIIHWNAIKTSTIDGFRGNWLIREGTLSKQQDKLSLSIEKKVYDILLNQSPFSFSVIRFPWMSETLYVNWPTS